MTQVQQESEDAPEGTFKTEETTNVVEDKTPQGVKLSVWINNEPFEMSGKEEYIFVDIFNFYPFDLTASRGRAIVTKINGQNAQFAEPLNEGDRIEIYWKEN